LVVLEGRPSLALAAGARDERGMEAAGLRGALPGVASGSSAGVEVARLGRGGTVPRWGSRGRLFLFAIGSGDEAAEAGKACADTDPASITKAAADKEAKSRDM
jgi:hypothetical protein